MRISFDWLEFCQERGIAYDMASDSEGQRIVVNCPFCSSAGDPDPSKHMSISLSGSGWHCWRDHDHRGRSPTKLIQGLLGCTYQEAAAIGGRPLSLPSDLLAAVKATLDPEPVIADMPYNLRLPPEFKPFDDQHAPSSKPYVGYLQRRGFYNVGAFTKRYSLYYAARGPFKGRVIFTVYADRELLGWVGRTIHSTYEPRYLALPTDPVQAAKLDSRPAPRALPDTVLWFDRLMKSNADTICVVEGPFDALKVNELGRKHGICATCLFTSHMSKSQTDYLARLLPRFKKRYILLDPERRTLPIALRMASDLAHLSVAAKTMPEGIGDPGELRNPQELLRIM
jgi:hypothetical protein